MWFSFWRSRDRFSLDELRYLTDQLKKVQIVNEVNKDFVIEALRSISELITYGDQHDPAYFEFFMESQVMGDFVRILKISRTTTISLQLLQTMSIMIQNLKSEHAIYYMFSNEHINYLITYSFDFRNDEIISYYISFLRAISGKLDKNTISLLVKIKNDEVVSFPLYVEAIRFAFHEESMIRTAIRALTLNVYHVGDDCVNRFVASTPQADYFSHLVKFFQKQCIGLNSLVYENLRDTRHDTASAVLAAVDEIEDNLFYISDVISAGIPDVGRLITENMLQLLIIPLLLPSLRTETVNEVQIGALTSLYLLCCILRIVKIKDLAHAVAAALFCPLQSVSRNTGTKLNGFMSDHGTTQVSHQSDRSDPNLVRADSLKVIVPNLLDSSQVCLEDISSSDSHVPLREALLFYITNGDDVYVSGSLCVLATLLQTKELDESMLDALGILPQRKQHKKLLLQALVGEESGEEQLFSTESSLRADGISSELDSYLRKLKDQYGVCYCFPEVGASPRVHKFQVLEALVNLFCRSNISAETLWDGGWLLRQLLPYSEAEFNSNHLKLLKESYKNRATILLQEMRGIWSDSVITVLCDEWRKCKRVIEGPSPRREPKFVLLPSQISTPEDGVSNESSLKAGEKMLELVKVFVLLHQLLSFSLGKALTEHPPIHLPIDVSENSRAMTAGLGLSIPKPGTEIRLVDAVPCRIAFERGKERQFYFLAISVGTSGWLVLADESPSRKNSGVVRVCAPLVGSNPRIDEKHSRWLHLRIRPVTLPFMDRTGFAAYAKVKTKALVDGRWTLAFKDEESCKLAANMILEEINLQSKEVERRLEPLFDLERTRNSVSHSQHPLDT